MKFAHGTRKAAVREANRLIKEFDISDSEGEAILRTFASCFSMEMDIMEAIKEDGVRVVDRFKQIKPNPMLDALCKVRGQKLAALKQLNLEVGDSSPGPGRPCQGFKGVL